MHRLIAAGSGIRIEFMSRKFGLIRSSHITRCTRQYHIILDFLQRSILIILITRTKVSPGARAEILISFGNTTSKIAVSLGLHTKDSCVSYNPKTWKTFSSPTLCGYNLTLSRCKSAGSNWTWILSHPS